MLTVKHGKIICVTHPETSSLKCESCKQLQQVHKEHAEERIIKEILGLLSTARRGK